jgi:alanyl-tRNA synthetase
LSGSEALDRSTAITYPQGGVAGRSEILLAAAAGAEGAWALITESTPFHPRDHVWPDQPADRGTFSLPDLFPGDPLPIIDVVTGARNRQTGELRLDREISARRGDPDWSFVVVHLVEGGGRDFAAAVGHDADLEVDRDLRRLLNASHTACHLMSIALNQVAAPLWKKDARRDSLGHPNLDKMAIAQSTITPAASLDRYRFGKSLRKEGFEAAALLEHLPEVREAVEAVVAGWLETGGEITFDVGEGRLDSLRLWRAVLAPGVVAEIPCGGSHLRNLRELAKIELTIERDPSEPEVTVRTVATLR